jgi:hypothetical protein
MSFVDLEPVFVNVVEDFYTAEGHKLYKKIDVRDELSCAVVKAAQSYSDEVAQAWTDAGFTVVRLVLSPNVLACYKAAGCPNQFVPCLPCHPCGHRGDTSKIRGIVAELHLLYATMIFEKGSYLSLTAALQAIHADQAQNKIAMQMWLQSLGVDLEKIHVKSFVHMHLTTSKLIWNHVCHRFPDNEKKALSVFLSRRWESDDLLECEHHVLKCLCWEYHSDRI